jgi:hypothetical protein
MQTFLKRFAKMYHITHLGVKEKKIPDNGQVFTIILKISYINHQDYVYHI